MRARTWWIKSKHAVAGSVYFGQSGCCGPFSANYCVSKCALRLERDLSRVCVRNLWFIGCRLLFGVLLQCCQLDDFKSQKFCFSKQLFETEACYVKPLLHHHKATRHSPLDQSRETSSSQMVDSLRLGGNRLFSSTIFFLFFAYPNDSGISAFSRHNPPALPHLPKLNSNWMNIKNLHLQYSRKRAAVVVLVWGSLVLFLSCYFFDLEEKEQEKTASFPSSFLLNRVELARESCSFG